MNFNPTNNTRQPRTNSRRNHDPKAEVRVSSNNGSRTMRGGTSLARNSVIFPSYVSSSFSSIIFPRQAESLAGVRLEDLEDVQVGAPQAVIDALPTYRQKNGADKDHKQCLICLVDFQDGHELCLLPCLHRYHTPCIHEWLKRNYTCPVCRTSIFE